MSVTHLPTVVAPPDAASKRFAAPVGLSAAAGSRYRHLRTDYEIEDAHGLLLLEQAMRCFDRPRRRGASSIPKA